MRSFASSALALTFATTVLAQDQCGVCQSFGVDFVSGGSYFQNSLSTDPFTAVQEFEGCTNDTSHNVFVIPNGDQYECTQTPMQPDDTPETLSCPIDKDQLVSGDYSLLILSNNGNCDPIDFQRDFSLSVGPQQTVSVAPTITISTVFTPVVSSTITSTRTITSTAKPRTSTVPLINLNPTITIFPLPAVTVVTKAILTVTSSDLIPNVLATSTATATATCQLPDRRQAPDPVASILATILGNLGIGLKGRDAMPEPTSRPRSAATEFKRAIIEGRAVAPEVKAQWLQERHEGLALRKRSPDEPTITITDTSLPTSTVSQTSTGPTSFVTGTTTLVETTTTTPVVTVKKGVALSIATVTAPQNTLTNTFFIPTTNVVVTTTQDVTLTITTTSTPASVAASCSSAGGVLSS